MEQSRNRPTMAPGGCECQKCGCVFIGDESHTECGICVLTHGNDRKAAESAYSSDAFHYERGPIGSRDWRFYHAGWQARAALTSPRQMVADSAQAEPVGYMNERMLSILASGMTACTTVSHKKTEYAQVAIYVKESK